MISEHQGDSWKPTTLEHCGRWISGGTPSRDRSDFWNGTVPWISAKSMNCIRLSDSEERVTHLGAENGAKFAPKGSILILVRGSMLHQRIPIGITTKDVTFNQDVKAIIPYSDVFPEFLLYWLLSNESKLLEMVEFTGIGAGKLSTDLLYNMEVKLPPLPEQRAIARILGSLDDKIEANRRMNETLEAMARAIFKSWFVDFDPVRAKAAGREPAGMDAETAALFPDSFEETELGMVPKGWEICALDDLMKLAYGKALKEENRVPGSVPVYGSNGQVGWHNEALAPGPGIIIGRKGNPGIVTWAPTDFFAIDTAFYVVPKTKCQSLYFLLYALSNQDLPSLAADSAVPGLNRNFVYLNLQLVPPPDVLVVFDRLVKKLFEIVYQNDLESRTLEALRDALLGKLLTGEIRLNDAEQFLRV